MARPDDVTLLVRVTPPASVSFGMGHPPGREVVNANAGWTKRTSG